MKRPLDRSMARAVAWSAAAKWITQVLSWASTIVVARLLTPSDYGLVGMAALYLNLASLVGQTGIGNAIIVLRDLTRQQIAELNTISLLLGVCLAGLTCSLAHPLARFFSTPPLFNILLITSITYVINAFQVVPKAVLQRDLHFKLLATIEMLRAFSQIISTVLFAWLGFRYWSLIFGQIVSCIVGTILTLYWERYDFAVPHLSGLKRELTSSRQLLVSGIAWYVYDNADFGVAGRVLGEAALGNYTVAWTISSAPVEKITNLVTGVTPAFFSALQTNKGELRRYLLRLTEVLSFLTIPASLGIALVADLLVPALLGVKWDGVIGPLRLLSIFFAARSLGTILSNLLMAIGDSRFVMWVTMLAATLMPVAFFVGSQWGTNGIAAAWVAAYPAILLPMYYRVFRKTELTLRDYISVLKPALTASVIMAVVVILTRAVFPIELRPLAKLLITVLIGGISYLGSLFVFHKDRVTHLIDTIREIARKD
jgi:O-antigen/teichoic acid export membrane protein